MSPCKKPAALIKPEISNTKNQNNQKLVTEFWRLISTTIYSSIYSLHRHFYPSFIQVSAQCKYRTVWGLKSVKVKLMFMMQTLWILSGTTWKTFNI